MSAPTPEEFEHIDDSDICLDCEERHAGTCMVTVTVRREDFTNAMWAITGEHDARCLPRDRCDCYDTRDRLAAALEAHDA